MTGWGCDSVRVWGYDSGGVRVWGCDSVRVWGCNSGGVRVWGCEGVYTCIDSSSSRSEV